MLGLIIIGVSFLVAYISWKVFQYGLNHEFW